MVSSKQLRLMCAGAGITTAWLGATPARATTLDMDYTSFGRGTGSDDVAAVQDRVKRRAKKTKAKAAKRKTKKKAAKRKTKKASKVWHDASQTLQTVPATNILDVGAEDQDIFFDFDLEFDPVTGEVFLNYHIFGVDEDLDTGQTGIGALIDRSIATSFIGVPWDTAFPQISMVEFVNALSTGNVPAILQFASFFPPLGAFLTDQASPATATTAPIDGVWISWPADTTMPSESAWDVGGSFEVIPSPSGAALLAGAGAISLGRRRRRAA